MKRKESTRPLGVYVVDDEAKKPFWTRVGAAWPHSDGMGFNITLNALPLSGRLVVREPNEQEER